MVICLICIYDQVQYLGNLMRKSNVGDYTHPILGLGSFCCTL